MNNASRSSRTNVFLMELIIVILFFSIAASVTLRIFQHADQLSRSAADLSYAVVAAEDAAERQRALPLDQVEQAVLYYDASWQAASENEAAFAVHVTPEFERHSGGTLVSFSISAASLESGESIYALNTKKYYSGQYQEEAGHEE